MCLEDNNSGIGPGRAKAYMEGFMDQKGVMEGVEENMVGEGSTIIGNTMDYQQMMEYMLRSQTKNPLWL